VIMTLSRDIAEVEQGKVGKVGEYFSVEVTLTS